MRNNCGPLITWKIFLLSLVITIPASARLVAEDPQPPEIKDAIRTYEEALKQARSELQNRLEREANAAQRAGDLARLRDVTRERLAFQKSETLPTVISVTAYHRQRAAALRSLTGTYQSVIRKLTQAGEIEQAESLQAAMAKFDTGVDSFESVQPNTIWGGICHQVNSESYPVTMYVIERSGPDLKVAFSFPTSPALEVAAGRATETLLVVDTSVPLGPKSMTKCTYTIKQVADDTLKGHWHGSRGKVRASGAIELTRLVARPGR